MNILWIPWLKVSYFREIFTLQNQTEMTSFDNNMVPQRNSRTLIINKMLCKTAYNNILHHISSKEPTNKQKNITTYEISLKLEYFLAIQKPQKYIIDNKLSEFHIDAFLSVKDGSFKFLMNFQYQINFNHFLSHIKECI